MRGRAYGVRQALDTVGAFIGSVIAIALMALLANDMRIVFWLALIPASIAVALVIVGVEEHRAGETKAKPPIRLGDLKRLNVAFWRVTGLGVIFTLARFSEAFLVLKASDEGLPLVLAPLVLVVMNAVYALGAAPAGALSDRISARTLLLYALGALVAADMALAFAPGVWGRLPASHCGAPIWR